MAGTPVPDRPNIQSNARGGLKVPGVTPNVHPDEER
jgi:hypothetical protein